MTGKIAASGVGPGATVAVVCMTGMIATCGAAPCTTGTAAAGATFARSAGREAARVHDDRNKDKCDERGQRQDRQLPKSSEEAVPYRHGTARFEMHH
jgi:hypothetical protein